ncbi:replication protein [Escherichia coli]|nr:replication protein [Escherichia coli]KAA0501154.1 replication protein [Escherichia coli]PPY64691.1 replication protein [Escherichia coli]PPY79818.1 replication protein [Escherichia coli]RLX45023.1 replication protein [Escherichia coli]
MNKYKHLPPQAVGPEQSHFSYNTQTEYLKNPVPRRTKATKPLPITEKRPRPGPPGRNRVAFNYECCN